MTTTAEKINALEWGIQALKIAVEKTANSPNQLVRLVIREAEGTIDILTEMKKELEAGL